MAWHKRVSRRFLGLALAGILSLSAAACGSRTSTPSAAGRRLPTLRIALDYTENVDYLGIYVAITKGYFAAQGIKPVIIPYSGIPAETLLETGKTDLGLTYPPNIPAYRAADPPLDYEAVAGLSQVNTIDIAVLASSPYHDVAQLSGKLYGGFGVPSDRPILLDVFRKAGVAHPVYREVDLGVDAYQALAAHRVAYSITFGGIDDVTAELAGVHLREFPIKRYLPNAFTFPDDAFVATDQEVKTHAELLRKGLVALAEGYEYAAHHPASAESILLGDNPAALSGSAAVIRATGNATAPTFLTPSGTWGQMSLRDFAGITAIERQGGEIPAGRVPPPASDFTNALLPSKPVGP
jgi:ABC-type nitrate/sulfonate/bicarbonate transport system substrate-binding protein